MHVLDGEHGGPGLLLLLLQVERVVVGEGGVWLQRVLHEVWSRRTCGSALCVEFLQVSALSERIKDSPNVVYESGREQKREDQEGQHEGPPE